MSPTNFISLAAFIGLCAFSALSPLPTEQPKTTTPKPHTITAEIHAVKVEPTPEPTPELTWQDNPQGCDQSVQWIAAESPYNCIDIPQPTVEPTQPPVVASRTAGAPQTNNLEIPGGSKYDWMASAGIPSDVWSCVDGLVTRESGWRVNATNSQSGAYGLPQSLPGNKMAVMGADWQTNPVTQLRWMAQYVTKYGGFCPALSFQINNGWY